uniref:TIR domain-containing protein n=1 Tax=Neogobius melanostomus TaxID=47308 RepID=A0A8C6UD49_9GOBI
VNIKQGRDGEKKKKTVYQSLCTPSLMFWKSAVTASVSWSPPELSEGESYHVFCSYSSTDYDWTHALIQQLEDKGLRVCDHERDFTAGRPILENMTESIEQSQKVMLVLSAEFLRSRWCLLEANMSMFRDCLQELSALSQDHELFHNVILKYSCAYTCCLAKRCFPFRPTSNTGHLDGTICFCQYVIYQRSVEETGKSNGCSCC